MSWQKISLIIGIVIGLFTIVGGVVGSQKYLEEKYAENEDVEHVLVMVAEKSETVEQMIAFNAKSIQLNQYRLEQKIIEDRIDRKRDLRKEIELKQPTSDQEHQYKMRQLQDIDDDIRMLERDLEKIDKP